MAKVTSLLVICTLLAVATGPLSFRTSLALTPPPIRLVATVFAVNQSGRLQFVPNVIQVVRGDVLSVTFNNSDSNPQSFTIRNATTPGFVVDTGNLTKGSNKTVDFFVNDTNKINVFLPGGKFSNDTAVETTNLTGGGTGIKFFSVPGKKANLTGVIVLAGPPAGGAQTRLYVTIHAVTGFKFNPDHFSAGNGTIVNVTFINSDTESHSFSLRDKASGNPIVMNTTILRGARTQVEFMMNGTDGINIMKNGVLGPKMTVQTFDLPNVGTGIKFFCIPHESSNNMVGVILSGTSNGPSTVSYPGFALWAFWIGTFALLGMIAFIGVTYFLVKGSSRRNVDEREHVRRGLP